MVPKRFLVYGLHIHAIVLCICWYLAIPSGGCQLPASKNLGIRVIDSGFIFLQAPFKSCHASTVASLGNGRLMAAWFGGTHEGHPDVAIWGSVYAKGKWSEPVQLADGAIDGLQRVPCWNPVLVKHANGRLMLFYKMGPNPRQWWGMIKISSNNGITWTTAERLPEGFLGPVKNKPYLLPDGSMLHPSSTESMDEKTWNILVEKSDAEAKNWQRIPIDCDTFGVIQPSILRLANGDLQLICRSRQQSIVTTISKDGGNSWAPLQKLDLPNPNSGSDAVTLKNGMHLLVYNPMVPGKNWWEGRSELVLATSLDGIRWNKQMTLEKHEQGEFSYPAIIETQAGEVVITYTYDRKNIKYIILR
jgi:alpha-L-fucosidase